MRSKKINAFLLSTECLLKSFHVIDPNSCAGVEQNNCNDGNI